VLEGITNVVKRARQIRIAAQELAGQTLL